jgi:hypothetical protein
MLVEVVSKTTLMTQFNRILCDVCRYVRVKNNWHDAVTQREGEKKREREREEKIVSPFGQ